MAWLDDRVWCHPKLADVSDRSFRIWISGMAYSSGFGTRGVLTPGHQRTIGSDARSRRELIAAGLWNEHETGIAINDWDEHNAKRDERRAADRERKRQERKSDPDGWITRSGKWLKTRKAVFARDQGICLDCGNYDESWHADHVPDRTVLREKGLDPFDLQWIETRCRSCHSRRHSLERHQKKTTDRSTDRSNGQSCRPAHVDRVTVDGSEGKALTSKSSEGLSLVRDEISRSLAGAA